jgi:hypothetical protein
MTEVEELDPVVPGFDELDRAAAVLLVGTNIVGDRRRVEVVERHEELHAEVVVDEIIEQKEAHVAPEVVKQGEEVAVARERARQRASPTRVVAANCTRVSGRTDRKWTWCTLGPG